MKSSAAANQPAPGGADWWRWARDQLRDRRRLDGAGGAYRSARFRLRERGPSPSGIGEERAVPAFVHAGRRFGRSCALDVYAGALLGGRVRVEDSGGGKLAEQDFDLAPFVGGTLSTRF